MIFVKNNKIEWNFLSMFIFSVIMLVYFASLQQSNLEAQKYRDNVKNADEVILSVGGITLEQAMEIAGRGECSVKGDIINKYFYNENSKTWWFDLTMKPEYKKDGCNPACVVNEETEIAEINWRCAGLIQ